LYSIFLISKTLHYSLNLLHNNNPDVSKEHNNAAGEFTALSHITSVYVLTCTLLYLMVLVGEVVFVQLPAALFVVLQLFVPLTLFVHHIQPLHHQKNVCHQGVLSVNKRGENHLG
jgi:hypothetical protein